MLKVTVQQVSLISALSSYKIKKWAKSALKKYITFADITIRIVEKEEMQNLNDNYRKKNTVTNVLSFPMDLDETSVRGDIVICAKKVIEEAKEQNKALDAHFAHLTIHGVLHLLGYDHIEEKKAAIMENLEITLLYSLGFPNPYVFVKESLCKKIPNKKNHG